MKTTTTLHTELTGHFCERCASPIAKVAAVDYVDGRLGMSVWHECTDRRVCGARART